MRFSEVAARAVAGPKKNPLRRGSPQSTAGKVGSRSLQVPLPSDGTQDRRDRR